MAKCFNIKLVKSYATAANAEKAIDRYPNIRNAESLRYFIYQDENGRFGPVFVGQSAAQAGVHFVFNVIG